MFTRCYSFYQIRYFFKIRFTPLYLRTSYRRLL